MPTSEIPRGNVAQNSLREDRPMRRLRAARAIEPYCGAATLVDIFNVALGSEARRMYISPSTCSWRSRPVYYYWQWFGRCLEVDLYVLCARYFPQR